MTPRSTVGAGRAGARKIAGGALAGGLLFLAIHGAQAQSEQRSVLALYAQRREAPIPQALDPMLQRILGDRLPGVDYYNEFIDEVRFADPEFQLALRDFLKRKYAGRRFDAVIAASDRALEIVKANSDELFAGVPVVFSAPSGTDRPPHSTGVTSRMDLARTLTMVTQLQPETKRVFVVSGSSAFDKAIEDRARAQFRAFEGRFEFTYWSGLPIRELLERVADLPPDSILYPLMLTQDISGRRFLHFDQTDRIADAANVPVYAWASPEMGRGVIGGSLYDPEHLATPLAEAAIRVLGGEKPEDIPVVEVDPNVSEVDWRQLRRWGISEARVPAGTTVRFREPGLWERYRSYIIGTLILLLLQTALIAGLLVQRVRRRRVERALRESEGALRATAEQNQDLAGRLITAQEEERARIARELHDDVVSNSPACRLRSAASGTSWTIGPGRRSGAGVCETLPAADQDAGSETSVICRTTCTRPSSGTRAWWPRCRDIARNAAHVTGRCDVQHGRRLRGVDPESRALPLPDGARGTPQRPPRTPGPREADGSMTLRRRPRGNHHDRRWERIRVRQLREHGRAWGW